MIQAESNGEAWYVDPVSLTRRYLGRPADAFALMRELGLGISDRDLNRVGVDAIFSRRLSGRILLQVQLHGEAWYVNPLDREGYFLGRPADAFALMRRFGLGISNADLSAIPAFGQQPGFVREESPNNEVIKVQSGTPVDLGKVEFLAMELVNQERVNAGVKALKWNRDLASVARGHSQSLAEENGSFTALDHSCDYPLIHHEGLTGGAYNSDRLEGKDLNYFNKSGENIALVTAVSVNVRFPSGDPVQSKLEACDGVRAELDREFKDALSDAGTTDGKLAAVRSELAKRSGLFGQTETLKVADEDWHSALKVAEESVAGWMNSPGHRRNILDPDFDEAGMGAAYVNGYAILTQSFIRRVDCGYAGGACCIETGYLPYCYAPLECRSGTCGN